MIVVTMTNCPPRLRGDITKWLMEINAGVYVGNLNARVRDELWKRICEHIKSGRATMVYSTNNEQGLAFYTHNTTWIPTDYEGITLIKRPLNPAGQRLVKKNFSRAKGRHIAEKKRQKKVKEANKQGYVVIDVETTGLNRKTDEIIRLAAIRIIDHKIVEEFSTLIKINSTLSEKIKEITGITDELIKSNGRDLAEALEEFKRFIQNSPIISHNLKFDQGFLNSACRKVNCDKIESQGHDTLNLARLLIDEVENYKLDTLVDYLDLERENEDNLALAECRLIFKLYEKLNEF